MTNKLKRLEVEEKLKNLGVLVFTPVEFAGFLNIPLKRAKNFITTNLGNAGSGLFLKLRNNYYILKDSHPAHYFVANKLYEPSYVSLETALSHYGIIPEVVYAVTSVTSKISREYKTPLGIFSYQRIKKQAFTGYSLQEVDGARAFIADPEKALADYLYFVDLKKVSLNDRLELRHIKKTKLTHYVRLFERKSIFESIPKIYAQYRQPRKIY